MTVLSRDGSALTVVPGRSAKIASLVDGAGTEWLAQPRQPLPEPARPGADFLTAEMCGWDECSPAVVAGRARVGEREVVVPDHGELWTARWSCRRLRGAVAAEVVGVHQDYRLRRVISPRMSGFRLDYAAVAGSSPVALCWVAHPQLRVTAGSVVQLAGARECVDVLDPRRSRRPWPDGGLRVGDVAPGGCAKVYSAPDHPVTGACLDTPGVGRLTLGWEAGRMPYCGVWIDRGACSREDVVAIEPATGYADELASAVRSGRVLWIEPGEEVEWWLVLTVEPVHGDSDTRGGRMREARDA